jgi:uncharacterized surface protein with fasciclin (FAS1) repeats
MKRFFVTFAVLAVAGLPLGIAQADCGSSHAKSVSLEAQQVDIVDVAVEAGSFQVLAKALSAAGLVDALKSEGPFTVLAPTDEAFARLPDGTIEELLKPENLDQLKRILTRHVLAGKATAADVVKLEKVETLSGDVLMIAANEDGIAIGNAKVLKTDVMASNGVIHVIDSVLLPN